MLYASQSPSFDEGRAVAVTTTPSPMTVISDKNRRMMARPFGTPELHPRVKFVVPPNLHRARPNRTLRASFRMTIR